MVHSISVYKLCNAYG